MNKLLNSLCANCYHYFDRKVFDEVKLKTSFIKQNFPIVLIQIGAF